MRGARQALAGASNPLRWGLVGPTLAAAWVLAAALAFWLPALRATGGHAPAPLDDVYIHFAYARSTALGEPMRWLPGQGFSSGATSWLYPIVLAPLWLAGLRGELLFVGAAATALACALDLTRSVGRLSAGLGAPAWSHPAFAALALGPPLAHWSLWSGMELAPLAALVGRSLLALREAERADAAARGPAQRRLGLWLALLPACRPEAAGLALGVALAAAYAGRATDPRRSLVRVLAPTATFLVLQASLQAAFTGELAAASAVRKFVTSDPYLPPVRAALVVAKNLVILVGQGLEQSLGPRPSHLLWWGLAASCALSRRTQGAGLALGVGGALALGAASLSTTAPFQNLRYVTPPLLLLSIAAALGCAGVARRRPGLATALALTALGLGLTRLPTQVELFARAAKNIAEQQVVVAARVAARAPRRVMVNDAGAIPYLSGRPALDGLGLGGLYGLPFARASVHGVPCVVELIGRLPAHERPDLLAVYASWWKGLDSSIAREVDRVRIDDNVICGDATKTLYEVDWSPLDVPLPAPDGVVLDELDVADLVSERAHAYSFRRPSSGYAVAALARSAGARRRWDGGRAHGESADLPFESWRVASGVESGPATLELWTDQAGRVFVEATVGGARGSAMLEEPTAPDAWRALAITLPRVAGGDRVELRSTAPLRTFYERLVR